jgi:hypothetical protein
VRLGRRIDEDGSRLGENPGQFGPQFLPQLVVEIGKRLVEEDQAGILHDGAGERRSLLLAARQAERRAVEIGRQPEQRGGAPHAVVDLGLAGTRHPQRRGDVLVDGHRRIVDELLVDHGNAALLHRHARDILAVEPDRAAGRPVQSGHQAHQACLARQRRPEKHVERGVPKGQRHVADVLRTGHRLRHIPQFQHPATPQDRYPARPAIRRRRRAPSVRSLS